MAKIKFLENAWEEYLYWQAKDKKSLKKINDLLKDISRNYFSGLGKPEPLKHNCENLWSRRIDDKNRIIYTIENDTIIIIKCKGHYYDK
ncbi:MAG: Txe/YoeB family addiction module toxin [Lachnospirales bacterium]